MSYSKFFVRLPRALWLASACCGFSFVSVDAALAQARPSVTQAFWAEQGWGWRASCLCSDGSGNVWVGSPGGVVRYNPSNGALAHYTTQDGLGGNNVCALAIDRQGRIWAGHNDQGVSVFNGTTWRHYGVFEGPIGEHVYRIAVSPLDGDVWLATSAGLSRYSSARDSWTNYSHAGKWSSDVVVQAKPARPENKKTGVASSSMQVGEQERPLVKSVDDSPALSPTLPCDSLSSLAFDSHGNLYVGTQSQGLFIGRAKDDFAAWRRVVGSRSLPLTTSGTGLPSDLVNDVLVTSDDIVCVATDTGLATSTDLGQSWSFLRGRDWQQKAQGEANARRRLQNVRNSTVPGATGKGVDGESEEIETPANEEVPGLHQNQDPRLELLNEDHITSLNQDANGLLWMGMRNKGFEVRHPLSRRLLFREMADSNQQAHSVSAILPQSDGSALYTVVAGMPHLAPAIPPFVPKDEEASMVRLPARRLPVFTTGESLPSAMKPPPATQLLALAELVAAHDPTSKSAAPVAVLPDDWTTRGDWLGRYGRYWACLAAMLSPQDYLWGAGRDKVEYAAQTGPLGTGNEGLRYWVFDNYTALPQALEMPPVYYDSRLTQGLTRGQNNPVMRKPRRQSEWDDHGERYPTTRLGPHIFVTLRIPAGCFVLSLYNDNVDGFKRDLKVSIRPHNPALALRDISDFESAPEWVNERWRGFEDGNYKKFVVQGPREITVQVDRNRSFNTVLAGVFLDSLEEEPDPFFGGEPWTLLSDTFREVSAGREGSSSASTPKTTPSPEMRASLGAAQKLWETLEAARKTDPQWHTSSGRLFYQALGCTLRQGAPGIGGSASKVWFEQMGTCYYNLSQFESWEKCQAARGLQSARSIEKSLRWDGESGYSGRERAALLELRAASSKGRKPAEGEND